MPRKKYKDWAEQLDPAIELPNTARYLFIRSPDRAQISVGVPSARCSALGACSGAAVSGAVPSLLPLSLPLPLPLNSCDAYCGIRNATILLGDAYGDRAIQYGDRAIQR